MTATDNKADTATPTSAPPADDDPHLWLEDVLGEKQLEWVEKCNKIAIDAIGDPKQTETYKRIKSILDSKVCMLLCIVSCVWCLC